MPGAARRDRLAVPGTERIDREFSKPAKGVFQLKPAPPGKIVPPETAVGKYRIPADKRLLPFVVQADAARGMAWRMEDAEAANCVAFAEDDIGDDTGRAGPEVEGKGPGIGDEPFGIQLMDSNLRAADMSKLPQPGGVVIVAVRENDSLDRSIQTVYPARHNARIDKDVFKEERVRELHIGSDPLSWHAE